jgi:hypothetical protein
VRAKLRLASALVAITVAVVAVASLSGGATEAHPGHPQKKLFEGRWHYEVQGGDYDSWMDLSTSDLWVNCANQAACANRWFGPFDASMADWNGQPTTVRFDYEEGVYNELFDVNVVVDDTLGDPGLLGFGPSFDQDGNMCFGPCDVYYGIVWVADQPHSGPYGTDPVRQATLTHELGHILQLRHESVNADESVLYECGSDDTGPIPHSVMSYDCIDPAAVGGSGEYAVQPFDTCGVNHTALDPAFGYAGCEMDETPTPEPTDTPAPTNTPQPTATPAATSTAQPSATPTPGSSQSPPPAPTESPEPTDDAVQRVWGDVNCSAAANPVDSLTLLRHDSGLAVDQPAGCPQPDDEVGVAQMNVPWGDVDCGGSVSPVDSLKVLRSDAGMGVDYAAGCPHIGDTVGVTG